MWLKFLHLIFIYCRLNIKKIIKTLTSVLLAFLVVSGWLHIDHYIQHEHDGYYVCNIGCNDDSHHSIAHQCDKCLVNDSNNPIFEKSSNTIFNQEKYNFFNLKIRAKSTTIDHTSYSRPPPFLT